MTIGSARVAEDGTAAQSNAREEAVPGHVDGLLSLFLEATVYCPFCGAWVENLMVHGAVTKCYTAHAHPGVLYLEGKLGDGALVQVYLLAGDSQPVMIPPPVVRSDNTQWEHHQRYASRGLHCGNLDCEVCPYVAPDDAPPIINGPFPIVLLPRPRTQARQAVPIPAATPDAPVCPCCGFPAERLGEMCFPCANDNHPISCPNAKRPYAAPRRALEEA